MLIRDEHCGLMIPCIHQYNTTSRSSRVEDKPTETRKLYHQINVYCLWRYHCPHLLGSSTPTYRCLLCRLFHLRLHFNISLLVHYVISYPILGFLRAVSGALKPVKSMTVSWLPKTPFFPGSN